MLEAGTELACEQMKLPVYIAPEKTSMAGIPALQTEDNDTQVIVSGDNFKMTIGKQSGIMESYQLAGTEMLKQGMVPKFLACPNR